MMSILKKITKSWIRENSFIVINIGFLHNMLPSPYCVTRPQWVNSYFSGCTLIMVCMDVLHKLLDVLLLTILRIIFSELHELRTLVTEIANTNINFICLHYLNISIYKHQVINGTQYVRMTSISYTIFQHILQLIRNHFYKLYHGVTYTRRNGNPPRE